MLCIYVYDITTDITCTIAIQQVATSLAGACTSPRRTIYSNTHVLYNSSVSLLFVQCATVLTVDSANALSAARNASHNRAYRVVIEDRILIALWGRRVGRYTPVQNNSPEVFRLIVCRFSVANLENGEPLMILRFGK